MANFPVDEAQIVALFMESIAYGIYLVTLGLCARRLFWDYQGLRRTVNWPMVVVAALMSVFATLDVALGLRHNLDAFIFYSGPGGPDGEFDDISNWVNVMKTVDTQMMSLIGDGMLIYRCYVVFGHSWKIILLPILLWLADVAFSVMIIFITTTLQKDTTISQQSLLKPFLYSFFVVTIVLNLITTGLIIWRIWGVNKKSLPHVKHARGQGVPIERTRLQQVIRIIIESGLLYTTLVIATFICELASSNAIYGVSDVLVIAVGISFNLIIIRVDQASAAPATSQETVGRSYPLRFVRTSVGQVTSARSGVEVMISQDIDQDISDPDKHEPIKDHWSPV